MKRREIDCSGVMVSAPQGRSGKTVACIALCAAFGKRGFTVQPFKKGPDYIDPSWLSATSNRSCRNLDPFLMPLETIQDSFRQACHGADLAVVEGAMGLYDGPESAGWGSTAHLAQLLELPVILVVDCTRMTGSVAAMVSGYQHFQSDVNIAAVILNNVAGNRHERKLVTAVEQYCGIPVVGSIPRDTDIEMTQRHLGHVPFPENGESEAAIKRICSKIEPGLDVETILSIAGKIETKQDQQSNDSVDIAKTVKIGVIRDRVFNFYYQENLEALGRAGAELVFINSLQDRLPEIDGLYIGGGFPEFFLQKLEANQELRKDIADAVEKGLPVYAECAGLMYLCSSINWQGQQYEMVGSIPAEIEFTDHPQGHGYVEAEVSVENPLFPTGLISRGHEFHHSKLTKTSDFNFVYRMKRGHGIGDGLDGIVYKNVFAAYTHLHALGTPQWAESFTALALREQKCRHLASTLTV